MGSKILAAAILGDVNAVEAHLSAGDVAALLKGKVKGQTVMHVAAMYGHTQLVKFLVQKLHRTPSASCLTEPDLLGRTPLHLAALNGKVDVVVELLKLSHGDPMCKDRNGQTPFHLAALNGHISVIRQLLQRSGHRQRQLIVATDLRGHTALHLAIRHGHVVTVQVLLKEFEAKHAIACKDSMGWTAVHSAAGMGRADIVEEIFNYTSEDLAILSQVSKTGWSPVHVASWLGHAEIVKLICEKECCVNTSTHNLESLTPLHMAAHNGHDAVVDYLLGHNDLQVDYCDALHRTALHYAARQGHTSVVSKLLTYFKSKAPGSALLVNSTDVNGITPLHLAAREGHEPVVDILVKEGANVNATTESSLISKSLLDIVLGGNPLHETVVDPMILEADCWCISRMTALHLAAKNGHIRVVQRLSKHPDVDIRALDGLGLMPQDWAEVRQVKREFLACLQEAPQSASQFAGETLARVPKKKLQILREEMMKWERTVAVMPPGTIHSFQSMQYMTEACEYFDKVGNVGDQDVKVSDTKVSYNLAKEDTRGMNLRSTPLGDVDTMERLPQGIHEIMGHDDLSGNTPLHVAVKRGHKKTMEALLKRGQIDDLNVKNSEGHTPLALAFENNRVDICKLILQNSDMVEDDLHEMLKTAVSRKWLDMGVLLLSDTRTRPQGGISVDLLDEASNSAEKGFLDVLLRRTTIKDRLLQERKEHMDSSGAMLGIAALIASVTYQGDLQPPQGMQQSAVLPFKLLNACAFYLAIVTTIAVAAGSLPIRHMRELFGERDQMRIFRGTSCVLLILSSLCATWAYAAVGLFKPLDSKLIFLVNAVGAIATTLCMIGFLIRYIRLYKTFGLREHGRRNGHDNEGSYLNNVYRKVAQRVQNMFSEQEDDHKAHDV